MAGKALKGAGTGHGRAATITGVEEIREILSELAPRHARNLLRATVHGMASEVAKETKSNIKSSVTERTGTLRKAVKSKRRKSPPDAPVADVIFTQGKGAKHDGYYWRFLEHGTARVPKAHRFVERAVAKINSRSAEIVREVFMKKLEGALKREAKKRGVGK